MVQGRGVNASLNETGFEQARKAGRALSNISFDHVFTSSLIRTHETISQFDLRDTPLHAHTGFDEISWGDQEGAVADFEAKNLYAATVNGWRAGDLTLNIGGGESPIQVMNRQKEAIRFLMEKGGENVLICMHGRAIRVLLCWLLNYPLNYMDGFPHHNCSYYSLVHNTNHFTLRDFNRTDHL